MFYIIREMSLFDTTKMHSPLKRATKYVYVTTWSTDYSGLYECNEYNPL